MPPNISLSFPPLFYLSLYEQWQGCYKPSAEIKLYYYLWTYLRCAALLDVFWNLLSQRSHFQAEMTVEMTLESDRVAESPDAVWGEGTLVTFLRVGLVDVLVTLQVVLTLEFFITLITSHLFSLAVAPDMSVKDGWAIAFLATDWTVEGLVVVVKLLELSYRLDCELWIKLLYTDYCRWRLSIKPQLSLF